MCAQQLAPEHRHVVNIESRSLLCACQACYLLFTHKGAAGGKYRAIPDRHLYLAGFRLAQSQWDQLQIPVGIAFFFLNSITNRVAAFYPSPAGATESLLALDIWSEIANANPVLQTLEPDVEALLVSMRRDENIFECFLVPIDACYQLTGQVRRTWKGFGGGEEAARAIEHFFAELHAKSREHRAGDES